MIEWFLTQVPWWVYLIASLPFIAWVFFTFGWKATLGAAVAIAAILGYRSAYKSGYNARQQAGDRDTDRAIRNANKGRSDADTTRDHDDGFRRD